MITYTIDTDGLCSKVTTGEVSIEEYGSTPDHLFVPIEFGMKRENIEITQPSYGNVLLYKIIDRENSYVCL